MVVVVALLVVPLPPLVLDALLALSFGAVDRGAAGHALIARPDRVLIFPSLLLLLTLLRLGLNVSSTRLILGRGYAGQVIDGVRQFPDRRQLRRRLVIFLILVVINFMVITKGAGRIAEVAARFTLDAMPGRQMAIDADLGAGLIDETEARPPPRGGRALRRFLRRDGRRRQVRPRRRGGRPGDHRASTWSAASSSAWRSTV